MNAEKNFTLHLILAALMVVLFAVSTVTAVYEMAIHAMYPVGLAMLCMSGSAWLFERMLHHAHEYGRTVVVARWRKLQQEQEREAAMNAAFERAAGRALPKARRRAA